MQSKRLLPLVAWLACLLIAAVIVWRAPFKADMSMFLPKSPTAEQQLLLDNLAAGSSGRLLLIAVEGIDKQERSVFSEQFVSAMRKQAELVWVNDGTASALEADQKFVFENRYLLSNRLKADSFSAPRLRESVDNAIAELSSATGLLTKSLLTSDPTGETMALVDQLSGAGSLNYQDGLWVTGDGKRLLYVCHTKALGADLDGQERALSAVKTSFASAKSVALKTSANAHLIMTGPAVFATESRDSIRGDVSRLSAIGTALILLCLALALRSLRSLSIVIVPMATSVLVATACIALMYGSVHGMVLGFGTTLIGEAVDYALYFLLANGPVKHFWRAIRLGAAISILGFAALMFSGFPGLEQLAVFSLAGLITAVLTTRYVLPLLSKQDDAQLDQAAHVYQQRFGKLDSTLHRFAKTLHRVRWLSLAITLAAAAFLIQARDRIMSQDLASLNPVSAGAAKLDEQLREATGAPDVRMVLAVQGADEQAVLQAIEALQPSLDQLLAQNVIKGVESPAAWLPSKALQAQRQALLPDAAALRASLVEGLAGAPLRPEKLELFVTDVAKAKSQALISKENLKGTQLGLLVESLLYQSNSGKANGLLSLRLGDSPEAPAKLKAAIQGKAFVLDFRHEANAMYSGYLQQTAWMAGLGVLAIMALLLLATRSLKAMAAILWPLLLALILTCAWFIWRGTAISLLHQMGLFLMIAVGSNYSLFCWLARQPGRAPSTPSAQLLACTTTVIGFGVLGLSQVPLLAALGASVGIGAALSLLLSWMWLGTGEQTAKLPTHVAS